jgi:hypothetical protein
MYPSQTKILVEVGTKDEMRIVAVLFKGVSNQVYAPQTKILEGGTKDEIQIFEACEYSIWATNH